MQIQTVVVRVGIVLALLLLVALGIYEVRESQTRSKVDAYYDNAFDEIRAYTPIYSVKESLGPIFEEFTPLNWPLVLGEIPGYANGIGYEIVEDGRVVDYYPSVVKPSEPLRWLIWRVRGKHRWVAVASMYDSSSRYNVVVMKRSGENKPYPSR